MYSPSPWESLKALEILGASTFSWFGRPSRAVPTTLEERLSAADLRGELVFSIQRRLYGSWYCTGLARSRDVHDPLEGATAGSAPLPSKKKFIARLSAANRSSGGIDGDWSVEEAAHPWMVLVKNGRRVRATRSDVVSGSEYAPLPGSTVALALPKELPRFAPGFYLVLGDVDGIWTGQAPMVRLYWNVRLEGAARFVEHATERFADLEIPLRMKLLADPVRYGSRCDAAVMYLERRDFFRARKALEKFYVLVAPELDPLTPLLTKKLARGLGLAEDPGDGSSFGMSRCRMVAEALVTAYERGGSAPAERLSLIKQSFGRHGVDWRRPYLNAGSEGGYDLYIPEPPQSDGGDAIGEGKRTRCGKASMEHVDVALTLGRAIASRALWHGDRCNWTAGYLRETVGQHRGGDASVAYGGLGPELYAGTSGIATFLAELAVETGHPLVRRTSLGAIRQATAAAGRRPATVEGGLYDGALGVALAGVVIGTLLDEDEILSRGLALCSATSGQAGSTLQSDLVSGIAGRIVALIGIARLTRDHRMLSAAERLGEALVARARRRLDAWTWPSPHAPRKPPLTGLSHGAAGIGLSLLQLYRATGDGAFRQAAEGAFGYEEACYCAEERNWPDYRGVEGNGSPVGGGAVCATAWCHGAPGIALTRLYAFSLLGRVDYETQALSALDTTKRWTEAALRSRDSTYSLCHGLAGNAAILAHGTRVLGDAFADGRHIAEEVADFGSEEYARASRAWPLELPYAGSPGLMVGESGIGSFYLALHRRALPRALMWEPGPFDAPSGQS